MPHRTSRPSAIHTGGGRWRGIPRSAVRVVLLGLLTGWSLVPASLRANPVGGTVVAGAATMAANGGVLNIVNSNGAIINWQSFSIGAGETTRFFQPSAASAVLNRVVGGNMSAIYGTLQSNGQVYLINPNGIMVGATGMINTAGFVASTLDVSDAAFSQYATGGGQLRFTGSSTAKVENLGTIAADGGSVFLIARQVSNAGTIRAARGTAGLYASGEVYLTTGQAEVGNVQVTAASLPGGVLDTGVSNSGLIEAVRAELKATGNMYALAINNTGTVRAAGATVGQHGVVHFTTTGGVIQSSGSITARNADGSGGEVRVASGAGGTTYVNGAIDAAGTVAGTQGGDVELTGQNVALYDSGSIDVSGPAGGGTVLIGGDAHGANAAVQNAQNAYLGADARVDADATDSGDGGKVVLWSDGATGFYGTISARGGANGGQGGWVETSGHNLDAEGLVTTTAALGRVGTWLLDPDDLTIDSSSYLTAANGSSSGTAPEDFFATANTASWALTTQTLNTALASTDVVISTSTGAITFGSHAAVSWTGSHGLTIDAATDIVFDAGATITHGSGSGSLTLVADYTATGTGTVTFNGSNQINFTGSSGGVTIDYHPASYASPGDYSSAVSMGSGQFVQQIWVDNAADLQALASGAMNVVYLLHADIDASGITGFTPIGTSTNPFAGIFDGGGHVIKNLTINLGSQSNVGLFGYVDLMGTVQNLGLTGVSITGNTIVGGLAAVNEGHIVNDYVSGTIDANSEAGGLAGLNDGTIQDSYSTATVGHINASGEMGGLVGFNTGNILWSYATGSVSGQSVVGGLVGANSGYVEWSYALGAVHGNTQSGGLIGSNSAAGTVENNYAAGAVTGTSSTGGLIGDSSGGTVSANYFNATVNPTLFGIGSSSSNSGAAPLTTTQMETPSSYAAWTSSDAVGIDGSGTWYIAGTNSLTGAGLTYPILVSELYSTANSATIVNSHQLELINQNSTTLAGSYTLSADIDLANDPILVGGSFVPIGDAGRTGHYFTGTFNGDGHVIENLVVNQGSAGDAGLFGGINATGVVENLGIVNANIQIAGAFFAGALAGENYGTIQNSYATGTLTVTGDADVGGLVGGNEGGGVILDSYADGTGPGSLVSGGSHIGGLVGYNESTITDTYAMVTVAAQQDGGGLVGLDNGGSLTDSYAVGQVTAATAGGVVGGIGTATVNITGTYWESGIAGSQAIYGIGDSPSHSGTASLTLAQMTDPSHYTWDFTPGSAWGIDGYTSGGQINGGLPYLQSQYRTVLAVTADSQTVVYGGAPSLTYTTAGGTPSSYVSNLAVTQSGSNVNAGTTNSLVASGTVLGPGYAVEFMPGTETITPAHITLAAGSGNSTYGGTPTDPGFSASGLAYNQDVSVLTGLSDDFTVTGATHAGNYAIGVTGTLANGNYVVDSVAGGTWTVNPASITLAAGGGTSVYGDALVDPGFTASGLVNGEGVSVLTGLSNDLGSVVHAGTYSIGVTGTLTNGDYVVSSVTPGSWTVTPAILTYVASAGSRAYGAADPTLAGTVTGFKNQDTQANATTGTLAFASQASVTSGVGVYGIVGSGLSAGDYTFQQAAVNASAFTISQAVLTLVLAGTITKTYDGTTSLAFPAANVELDGLVNSDTVTVSGSAAYASANAGSGITVSATGVALGGAASANYVLASSSASAATGVITPAALTITADDATKTANSLLAFTGTEFTASGLQNGETVASVSLSSGGAPASAPAGTYAITASGAAGGNGFLAANYNVGYVDGTLTVGRLNTFPGGSNDVTIPDVVTKINTTPPPPDQNPIVNNDSSGSGGGTDKPVGSGSNGDPDTGNGTGSGKKDSTLGKNPPGGNGGGDGGSHGSHDESVVHAGPPGTMHPNGGPVIPPPPSVIANFNKVLGPAVMNRLKQALQ